MYAYQLGFAQAPRYAVEIGAELQYVYMYTYMYMFRLGFDLAQC